MNPTETPTPRTDSAWRKSHCDAREESWHLERELTAATARAAEMEGALRKAGMTIHVTNVEHGNYWRCSVCRGENGVHEDDCFIGKVLANRPTAPRCASPTRTEAGKL